jgi:hypothetical protein
MKYPKKKEDILSGKDTYSLGVNYLDAICCAKTNPLISTLSLNLDGGSL